MKPKSEAERRWLERFFAQFVHCLACGHMFSRLEIRQSKIPLVGFERNRAILSCFHCKIDDKPYAQLLDPSELVD